MPVFAAITSGRRASTAKHAAGQVLFQFGRTPEPAVVGHVDQNLRIVPRLPQGLQLVADHVRHHGFVADIRGQANALDHEELGPRTPTAARPQRREVFQPRNAIGKGHELAEGNQVRLVVVGIFDRGRIAPAFVGRNQHGRVVHRAAPRRSACDRRPRASAARIGGPRRSSPGRFRSAHDRAARNCCGDSSPSSGGTIASSSPITQGWRPKTVSGQTIKSMR